MPDPKIDGMLQAQQLGTLIINTFSSCLPPLPAGSTRCQNVVFQMATSVRPDINYLSSLTDSALGAAVSSSSASSSALRSLPSPIQQAIGPSGGGAARQTLNLLSMPDRNFMDGFTCHASVQPGMLRVWMKILQQGPSSAKFRIIALPPGYDAGELVVMLCAMMGWSLTGTFRHSVGTF